MIIYHGSNTIVKNPEIITSEIGRDFGFGFYTTDIYVQATRWAKRKTMISRMKINNSRAILNIYEYNNGLAEKELNIKVFDAPSMDWMEFVIECRSNVQFRHDYDIVIGNIANDNVGETISFVMEGIMRKEDALERLKFQKINNQICFNSLRSFKYLKFISYEILE